MRIRTGWRAAVAAMVLLAVVGGGSITAQERPHRFFGLPGDVTVDGEPVGLGDTVTVVVGERELGQALVNDNGIWFLDIDLAGLSSDHCHVTFVVRGISAEQTWDTCPGRVRLALVSASDEMSDDSPEPAAAAEAEPGDSDAMAEDGTDEMSEDPDQQGESTDIVRPGAPGTGSGGLLSEGETGDWLAAAALTAALMLAVSAVALLISRRTDGAN